MASYQPVPKEPEPSFSLEGPYIEVKGLRRRWIAYGLVLFVLTNLFWLSRPFWMPQEQFPSQLARTDDLDIVYQHFWWNTAYSTENHSDADYLWDEINPAHGIVSVDREWAAKRGWPLSGYPPGDKSKAVYLLEAYHLLHCLCNADNTPLYTFGDHTAGDGQLHRCKDWQQLRSWAAENSACYRDSVEDILYKDHFGFCRGNGDDGVKPIDYGAIIPHVGIDVKAYDDGAA
ncbi:hypothetical protein FHL15_002464 [Xylaria flabelliformis]|uniref:Uncharacterized protein n=1 Tax=Xylaria flabelliformis TaxID=2512241 RepID=A0A553I8Q8_9PEZI|nr:hypothetical protein FHL15_002464 [Xylaria flabelliformis]